MSGRKLSSTAGHETDDLDDEDQEVAAAIAASPLFRRRQLASSAASSSSTSSSNYHRSGGGAGSSLESQVIGQIIGGETGRGRTDRMDLLGFVVRSLLQSFSVCLSVGLSGKWNHYLFPSNFFMLFLSACSTGRSSKYPSKAPVVAKCRRSISERNGFLNFKQNVKMPRTMGFRMKERK